MGLNRAKKNILILVPYPKGLGPSQRFRVEIYFNEMDKAGLSYEYHEFLDEKGYGVMYKEGNWLRKAGVILRGFARRMRLMFRVGQFDKVLVQRECTPIGPPVCEWIMTKLWRKPLVYDIDDAIWLPNYALANARFHRLKYYKKINSLMRWSAVVLAGNDYLAQRAHMFNSNVVLMPTIVDTEEYHRPRPVNRREGPVVLGWTGTHSTNRHVEYIAPALQELEERYNFRLLIISNQKPDIQLKNMEYRPWTREREIEDLHDIDIGLMPLIPDFAFAKGKCGFKAIQFMALGLPCVVSPLGVNSVIVKDGHNGLICDELDEWKGCLEKLLNEELDANQLGREARRTVVERYSLVAYRDLFIDVLMK